MTQACPDAFIALAERLAEASGPVVRRYFRTELDVEAKRDASPVTIADREAEAAMRDLIEQAYPEHGIFGEEHGFVRTDAEYAWVLDPIDGTKAFVTGMPIFGTLIALMQNGAPILGIIDQPVTGERWVGAAGRPTTLNGAPARAQTATRLSSARHYATHPDMFVYDDDKAKVDALIAAVRQSRYGGDCYAYGLLASGHVDVITEACLKIYDFMPLVPVIEGAGGVVTDWTGAPLTRESDGHVLAAANPALHGEALAILQG
ncbi:MAG: histidinol-phosphatase [Alphaproteobacteria bacterium]|nr:histidinol-phosphatase [Alphaproteobacteria bacterium]